MEYLKLIDLLENTQNQSSKYRTKSWVENSHDSRRT